MPSATPSVVRARELIEAHLQRQGLSAVHWAAAQQVSLEVLERLLHGEYPEQPSQLHAIGRALSVDDQRWAHLLAGGICRCTPLEVEGSARARWWRLLISRGLTVAAAAAQLQLPERSLLIFARSGCMSRRLLRSALPAFIGVNQRMLLRGHTATGDAVLAYDLEQAMRERSLTVSAVSSELGMSHRTLSRLMAGEVPRALNPRLVPPLARRLELDAERLGQRLALSYRAPHGGTTLSSLLMQHCFSHGEPPRELGKRLGITPSQLRSLLGGRMPHERVLSALRQELALPSMQWELALRSQRIRRLAVLGSQPSLSLSTLIEQAINEHGGDPLHWALSHGLSPQALRQLLHHGRIPRRVEIRQVLIRALALDRPTFDAACRRMLETAMPAQPLDCPLMRTPLQEHFQRVIDQGRATVRSLARSHGVSVVTIAKILRYGCYPLRLDVREKLRNALGLGVATFERSMQAATDERRLDVDHELQLLSLYRRLHPAFQRQLVEIGDILSSHGA